MTVDWKVRLVHLIFTLPLIQEQIVQATARVDVHLSTVVTTRLQNVEVIEVILQEQCQQMRFFF